MTVISHTRPPSAPPRRWPSLSSIAIQTMFVALVFGTLGYFIINAVSAVQSLGMTTGFGFLERARAWSLPPSVIESPSSDTYAHTLVIAAVNTFVVGFAAIVLSTLFGFLLGVAQVGRNPLLRGIARTFVQVFRNIPTIVYVVFIFGIMLNLPAPRRALNILDIAFLSNRGLLLPSLQAPAAFWYSSLFILIAGVTLTLTLPNPTAARSNSPRLHRSWLGAATALALVLLTAVFALFRELTFSVPELVGFNFSGGTALSIEVTTLTLAITLFGTAYIGEIVRGGLLSVPKGNLEAAGALGLRPSQVFRYVQIPIALRSIVPALSNQYLYMMKATSLGIVIGYADLFTVASLSINYSGQTLEILGLMMLAFIVMNFTLSRIANVVNARLQFKTNGG